MDASLPTPCFVVDVGRVERNCDRLLSLARVAGISLRPHAKTHKTIEGVLLSCGVASPADARIVVSTLAEAEFFAERGVPDILYAIPIEPSRIKRAAAISRSIKSFHVMVDSPEAIAALQAAEDAPEWSVFLAIDATLYGREGVSPSTAPMLAAAIHSGPRTRLAGIYSHSGNSYNCTDAAEGAQRMAALERDEMVALARRLRDSDIPVHTISIGATPSSMCGDGWDGVTELHAGNFVFFDRQQVLSGSCSREEVACYVLARVVSVSQERGEALIDAGATALHKDAAGLSTWGELLDEEHAGLVIRRMTQELGVIGRADGSALGDVLKLGDVVRILPNHSCMTAAGHNVFHVVREREGGLRELVGRWIPARGW